MDYTLKHTYGRYAAYGNAHSSPLRTSGRDASIPVRWTSLTLWEAPRQFLHSTIQIRHNVSVAATRWTGASKLLEELVGDASGDFGAPA